MDTVADLVEDAEQRMAEQAGRIAAYNKYAGAYFRDTADAGGPTVRGSYGDGRMALQWIDRVYEELDDRGGAPKIVKAMVDDIVSVRGVLPNMAVVAEDATPEAEKMADKRTRGLRQWWHYSRMISKQPRAAWALATKGDVLYTLNPRFPAEADAAKDPFKPPGIYIDVPTIDTCFPRFRMGEDSDQLDDLFIITRISRHAARELYGVRTDEDEVQVIVYYDDEVKRTVVDGVEVYPPGMDGPVIHNLGFVPAEWHANKPTDGRFAQADINDCVELERTMQRQFHVLCDAHVWATYPIAFFKGKFAGDQQEYGPGAKVEGDAQSQFALIAPEVNVPAAQAIYDSTKGAIMEQAGVSPVRMQGSIDRSNVTGRAVAAQMSPQEARLSAANERLAGSLQMLNSKMMLMFAQLDGFQGTTLTLDAVPQHGQGKDTITPEEFGGWVANRVMWDSALHLNMHERLAMGLQLRKEGLFAPLRVLEYIGEEDPERTLRDATAAQQADMQRMMAAQGGGQPPPGGAPGPTPPGSPQQPGGNPTAMADQGMAMAQGGDGGQPGGGAPVQPAPAQGNGQAPKLSGFEPLAAPPGSPMGTPGPLENPVAKVDQALQGVQLFGQVLQRYPTAGEMHVFLSDHRDIAQVKAALRAAIPDFKLDVRVMPKTAPASSNGRSH